MVRTTVKPENQDISIHIPEKYIGRELEILLYPVDEITEERKIKRSIASLRGALHLSDEEKKDLQSHLQEIRSEWDRSI